VEDGSRSPLSASSYYPDWGISSNTEIKETARLLGPPVVPSEL